jgi:GAF domain-containing protein
LAAVVLVDRPLEDVLDDIVGIAHKWLPGAEATSITLAREDRAWTAAFSGPLGMAADELQYGEGYGPCMDAARTGLPMLVHDMRSEDRWPTYAPRVVRRGVLSSLSMPLPFQGATIGALNNYSSEPHSFDDGHLDLSTEIAAMIGIAVMNADVHARTAESARDMRAALESRKTIDMALGILVATHHCTPDEAFAMLSRTSQEHNRKLRDLARALVEAESSGV